MTDIFISYAREDRAVAGKVAEALTARGFKVWWDWDLIGGDNYRLKIREVIDQAKKTIVLWSRQSVMSAFVIDEASEAKKLGKLIPVSIDGSDPPFGFGDLHTIPLGGPQLDVDALVAALEGKPPPREQDLRRPKTRFSVGMMAVAAAALCLLAVGGGGTYWALNGIEVPRPPTAKTQRVALVIGNGDYAHVPRLENPVRDAHLVAGELEKRGFRVTTALNLTAEAMIRAFTVFETSLAVYGGVGVYYYTGHAVFIDGKDIMLPVDATADMTNRKIANGVNLTQLQSDIKSRIATSLRNNGHAMIYAASKGELSSDGPPGGNSPFATALASALSHADDELGDTYHRIRGALAEHLGQNPIATKQTPYFENQLGGKFYFNKSEQDAKSGISKILFLDSCRDNPFKMDVATR